MARETLTDGELVTRTRRGDHQAFDALVRRYLRPALAVGLEIAPSREDAEDLVQDAFHKALRHLDRFDARRPFGPWFFTILRNLGRSAGTAASRWVLTSLPDDMPVADADPLTETERAELQGALTVAMERLSDMQQTCFRLCDIEGFRGPEVAEMLGVSEATVRTHVYRARRALRQSLGSHREGSGIG